MSGSPEGKLYDLTTLQSFGGDDPAFMKDIITLFVTNGRKDLAELQEGVAAMNIEQVFQVAHRMKSTLHTMGIHSIETTVKLIDSYSRNHTNIDEIPALAEQVQKDMVVVFDQLISDFGLVIP